MSESLFRKAKRKNLFLKMQLGGPSGAGKTYSALKVAKGFMGSLDEVAVIDTEDSADVYDKLGGYSVLPFKPPFDPRRFVKAIDMAVDEGFKFLIIDSATKEWDGPGGCLQIHEKLGGKYQDWAKVTPMHEEFLQKIVQSPIHIISTTRKKQEYAMQQKGNRMAVEKLGMKNIQRDGFEYEVTLALDLDINHVAIVNKDRTSLFEEICPVTLDESHGEMLRAWCEGTK